MRGLMGDMRLAACEVQNQALMCEREGTMGEAARCSPAHACSLTTHFPAHFPSSSIARPAAVQTEAAKVKGLETVSGEADVLRAKLQAAEQARALKTRVSTASHANLGCACAALSLAAPSAAKPNSLL